jgi:choline-glycine betaine transporter
VKPQPRTPTVYLLVLWSVAVTAVTYIAALGGAVAGLRRRDPLAAFCVLAILLLLMGSSGYQAHARFRVPMIPYLALLATLARPPARGYAAVVPSPRLTPPRTASSTGTRP